MIEVLLPPMCVSAPTIRFSKGDGGFLNAFGGGKKKYVKGSHYVVANTSKHPYNIITEEIYDNENNNRD